MKLVLRCIILRRLNICVRGVSFFSLYKQINNTNVILNVIWIKIEKNIIKIQETRNAVINFH